MAIRISRKSGYLVTSRGMPSYLCVARTLACMGGGEGMACYFLEELLTRGSVCVLTPKQVSLEEHDRIWGTRLAQSELEIKVLQSPLLNFLRRLRIPTVRLETHLLCRAARKLRNRFTYCTVIPGELDLGAPSLQVFFYVCCLRSRKSWSKFVNIRIVRLQFVE